jgi:hypothetical protein
MTEVLSLTVELVFKTLIVSVSSGILATFIYSIFLMVLEFKMGGVFKSKLNSFEACFFYGITSGLLVLALKVCGLVYLDDTSTVVLLGGDVILRDVILYSLWLFMYLVIPASMVLFVIKNNKLTNKLYGGRSSK